jgi:RNA polymerase sigma-70 factor (ECF subfamily)
LQGSEDELVRAAAGGDGEAFHALIDCHAPALFRAALGLTRTRADAEDLVQETLVGAYRGIGNFAGRSSVKTWLLQILTRQAAKAWHRNRHQRRTLSLHAGGDDDDNGGTGRATLADQAAANSPAGGDVAAVESRLDVMAVLQKLSPPHREILVLREMRQLSYEEIAQVLGVPRGTVESRLSRARADFRACYESERPRRGAGDAGGGAGEGSRRATRSGEEG